MYCHHCGKEVHENAQFCSHCGAKLTYNQEEGYYQPLQQQTSSQEDESSLGFAILSFFFPIVGLVLFLIWKNDFPQKAKSCLKGMVSGIVLGVVIVCCFLSVFFKAVSDIDDSYDYSYDNFDGISQVVPYDNFID